jgi:hypothetical protein
MCHQRTLPQDVLLFFSPKLGEAHPDTVRPNHLLGQVNIFCFWVGVALARLLARTWQESILRGRHTMSI